MATEREATQTFEIRNILIDYCGLQLTPTLLDNIVDKATKAMKEGPCAWAFKGVDTMREALAKAHEIISRNEVQKIMEVK